MTDPRDLRELVGDVPPDELEELRELDALLRSVPGPPPPLPPALARPPAPPAPRPPRALWFRVGRLAAAAAAVAAVAVVVFAAGLWIGGREDSDDLQVRTTIPLEPTDDARGASAIIRLGERDASGTWTAELTVSGLPKLPPGAFYVLWLAKDGKYAGTCGSFRVHGGRATWTFDAAYRLTDYDEWVISARSHGLPRDPRLRPWLLHAKIQA